MLMMNIIVERKERDRQATAQEREEIERSPLAQTSSIKIIMAWCSLRESVRQRLGDLLWKCSSGLDGVEWI